MLAKHPKQQSDTEKHRNAPQFHHDGPEEYNPGVSIFKGNLIKLEKSSMSNKPASVKVELVDDVKGVADCGALGDLPSDMELDYGSTNDIKVNVGSFDTARKGSPDFVIVSSSDDETSRASKPRNRQGKVTVTVVSSDGEISMERDRKMKARAGKRKRQSKVSGDILDDLARSLGGLSSTENTPTKKTKVDKIKEEEKECTKRTLFDVE